MSLLALTGQSFQIHEVEGEAPIFYELLKNAPTSNIQSKYNEAIFQVIVMISCIFPNAFILANNIFQYSQASSCLSFLKEKKKIKQKLALR